jgi:5-methylcytosine-specific restriction endonuclease McrA
VAKIDKARQYKQSTVRRLDTLSRNECAEPSCSKKLVARDGMSIISKICHIEAASKEGPRYNLNSNDEYRRSFENLILLCDECHIIIDNKENENQYPVSLLKSWKENHEAKSKADFSKQGLSKYPSALGKIITILSKNLNEFNQNIEPEEAPDTSVKISYNNVVSNKVIIEEYRIYQGTINRLYTDLENQGLFKKESILRHIKHLYLVEKQKHLTIDAIQKNADLILNNIKTALWEKVDNTEGAIQLDGEAIEMCIDIVMVDAFMRCNILEEPKANDSK